MPVYTRLFEGKLEDEEVQYRVCQTYEQVMAAISTLSVFPYIFLDCEGKTIGNTNGILSIISLGSPLHNNSQHIFLLDTLALADIPSAREALKQFLSSESVIKVVWDGRMGAIEVYHNFGTVLAPVLDLQLVEVLARKTIVKESDKLRLWRLGERFGLLKRIKKEPGFFTGVHVATGMQACVNKYLPHVPVCKEENAKMIFTDGNDGSCLSLQRPLLPILRDHSAADIRLLGHIFNCFSGCHSPFIRFGDTIITQTMLDLSRRYVSRNGLTAREAKNAKNTFRVGCLFMPDALTAPVATLIQCTSCSALLPPTGFQFKTIKERELRRQQCRICVIGDEISKMRRNGKAKVSLPATWVTPEVKP